MFLNMADKLLPYGRKQLAEADKLAFKQESLQNDNSILRQQVGVLPLIQSCQQCMAK